MWPFSPSEVSQEECTIWQIYPDLLSLSVSFSSLIFDKTKKVIEVEASIPGEVS